MLTGSLPFKVESNNLTKLHATILRGPRIPPTLSRDCQDLLRKLLEPADLKRISIKDIMTHPWINAGCDRPLKSSHPHKRRSQDDLDPRVIRYIAQKCGVSEADVRDSVLNEKLNAIGGTYNIFMHRQNRGIMVPLADTRLPCERLESGIQKDMKEGASRSTENKPTVSFSSPRKIVKENNHPGENGSVSTSQNEESSSSPKLPELEQSMTEQTVQSTGMMLTKSSPSDSYRECIKQLKERSHGMHHKGILKPQSGKSDKSGKTTRSVDNTASISSKDYVKLSFEGIRLDQDNHSIELQGTRARSGDSSDTRSKHKGVRFTMSRGNSARLDNKYLISRLSTAQTTATDRNGIKNNRFIPELTFRSRTDVTSSRSKGSDLLRRINSRERQKAEKIMAQMDSKQILPPPPPPNSALGRRDHETEDDDDEYSHTTVVPIVPVNGVTTKVRTSETCCCGNFQLKINIVETLPNGGLPARSKSMPEFAVRKLGTLPNAVGMPYFACDYEKLPWWPEGKISMDYLYENQLPRV